MTEIIEDEEGYTFKRRVNEWSLHEPLVEWSVDSGLGGFIIIEDDETIYNLEQSYYSAQEGLTPTP
jgi:hypothetical protein